MDAPPVQYVKTRDGVSIAYAVTGSGTPLVMLPGAFEHAQLAWQYPLLQTWLELLAERFRLILIDERGAGMSQRDLPGDIAFTDYLLDVEAVLQALAPGPVVLFGVSNHALTALKFAGEYPDRVAGLILSGLLDFHQRSSFWTGLPAEDWDLFLRGLVPSYLDRDSGQRMIELLKQAFTAEDWVRRRRSLMGLELQQEDIAGRYRPCPRAYANPLRA
jgi:pimeloyl-ACP methyl ester carboxylesterase